MLKARASKARSVLTRRLKGAGLTSEAEGLSVLRAKAEGWSWLTSSLRYILGMHPDPLLVELLIGAVVLDLGQSPVDGVD
jgi:hypothetical protein